VVLYELAAGSPPFKADNLADLLAQSMYSTPALPSSLRPDLPIELEDLIMKLLARRPEDRCQSAAEVLEKGTYFPKAIAVYRQMLKLDPKDLKIDVYRSSGPGGQSVNTTDSAVRVTHVPTNLVVTCQDEKSQHKNKAKALKILKARLLDRMEEEQNAEISKERKNQVGSGDRSERIRTYNFPQNRVTDHRIGLTLYHLEAILEGKLDEVIDPLSFHYQTEAMKDGILH